MEKIFFTILFIGSVISGYAQVSLTVDQYDGINAKIDSLKDGWQEATIENVHLKNQLNKQIDSLTNLSQNLEKKSRTLISEKETLFKDNKSLKKEVEALISNAKGKGATVKGLETELKKKNVEYTSLQQQKETSEKKEYERGKQEALSKVTNYYSSLSFDEMIKASSGGQVNRDLKIVVDRELKQKLKNLKIYFSAKEVLAQKFDNESVQSVLQKTKTIKEKSSLVEKLIDNIDNYQLRNDALKEAIQEIQDIDNREIANTEKDQKKKKGRIMAEVAWYFYNYDFNNFEDYPYLSSIIIEIMNTKNKDANIDITDILDKL